MRKYTGNIETKFWRLIPFIIGVSKTNVGNKTMVYTIHLTPFLEIGFHWKGTRNGLTKN